MKTATGPEALANGVYLHACPRSELMIFTVLLGLAAAVDMHQKVTPVQKVPATEHGLISFDRTEEEEFQNLESLRLWLMSEGVGRTGFS